MKKRFFFYSRCLFVATALHAVAGIADTVYKSEDAQGNPVFTDLPTPNSEKIEIQPAQTYSPPAPASSGQNANTAYNNEEAAQYTINIIEPENDTTLTTNITSINVSVSITPDLRQEDQIQVLLNGEVFGPYDTTTMTLFPSDKLPRGSYTLQALIVSKAKPTKVLAQSPVVTLYQRRTTIHRP